MVLRNFFRILCSTWFLISSASCLRISSRSHAIYPPSKLSASYPFSTRFSATSILFCPLLQQIINFFDLSTNSLFSISSAWIAIAPGISPCAISDSFRISINWYSSAFMDFNCSIETLIYNLPYYLCICAKSFNTSPAIINPTTEGTNATLPGMSLFSVHLCLAPGGQMQWVLQLIAISSIGLFGISSE